MLIFCEAKSSFLDESREILEIKSEVKKLKEMLDHKEKVLSFKDELITNQEKKISDLQKKIKELERRDYQWYLEKTIRLEERLQKTKRLTFDLIECMKPFLVSVRKLEASLNESLDDKDDDFS